MAFFDWFNAGLFKENRETRWPKKSYAPRLPVTRKKILGELGCDQLGDPNSGA